MLKTKLASFLQSWLLREGKKDLFGIGCRIAVSSRGPIVYILLCQSLLWDLSAPFFTNSFRFDCLHNFVSEVISLTLLFILFKSWMIGWTAQVLAQNLTRPSWSSKKKQKDKQEAYVHKVLFYLSGPTGPSMSKPRARNDHVAKKNQEL